MEKLLNHFDFKILISCLLIGILNFILVGFDQYNIPYEFLSCYSWVDIFVEILRILNAILPTIAMILIVYASFICVITLIEKDKYWWLFETKTLIPFLVTDPRKALYYNRREIPSYKKIPYVSITIIIIYISLILWLKNHSITYFLHFVFFPIIAGLISDIIRHRETNFIITRKAMVFGAYILATLHVSACLSTIETGKKESIRVNFYGKDNHYNAEKYVVMLKTSTHILLKDTITNEFEKLEKDNGLCYKIQALDK